MEALPESSSLNKKIPPESYPMATVSPWERQIVRASHPPSPLLQKHYDRHGRLRISRPHHHTCPSSQFVEWRLYTRSNKQRRPVASSPTPTHSQSKVSLCEKQGPMPSSEGVTQGFCPGGKSTCSDDELRALLETLTLLGQSLQNSS